MNWAILIPVGIAAAAFIVFLLWQNFKDERKFEKQLKEDYPKSKEEEGDIDTEEVLK